MIISASNYSTWILNGWKHFWVRFIRSVGAQTWNTNFCLTLESVCWEFCEKETLDKKVKKAISYKKHPVPWIIDFLSKLNKSLQKLIVSLIWNFRLYSAKYLAIVKPKHSIEDWFWPQLKSQSCFWLTNRETKFLRKLNQRAIKFCLLMWNKRFN